MQALEAPDLTPVLNPYGMLPDGNWGQWWSPDDAGFAEAANLAPPNACAQEKQFIPNYTFDQDTPTRWESPATSLRSYTGPSPSTVATSTGASPDHDESRRNSQASQQKRKRSTATTKSKTPAPATKSTRRASTRKSSKAEPAVLPTEKPKQGSKSKASAKLKQEQEDAEFEFDHEGLYDAHNKKVQERNRIASNKFRVKKRQDALRLRADEEDMERVNRDLTSCVSDLTMQVYELKMKLLQHTDCECHLIQNYIATEAQKYIKDLGDGKHPNTTPALPPPHLFQQAPVPRNGA